jgi:hypothetical protein
MRLQYIFILFSNMLRRIDGGHTNDGACGLIRCKAKKPYQDLTCQESSQRERDAFKNMDTGGAWLL